jgi:DNA-binding CsgD family transcriptional regulator
MTETIGAEQHLIPATVISERHILQNALRWTLRSVCEVEGVKSLTELPRGPDGAPLDRILIIEQTHWTPECLTSAVHATSQGVIAWLPSFSPEVALTCVELGVRGVLGDRCTEHEISQCVTVVGCGGSWMPQEVSASLLNRRICKLTSREAELVTLLASGLRNKEIAYALGITEGTVKVYLSKIFTKVGVSDRFELALFALRTIGLLPPRTNSGAEATLTPGLQLQTIPRRVFPLKAPPAAMGLGGSFHSLPRSA